MGVPCEEAAVSKECYSYSPETSGLVGKTQAKIFVRMKGQNSGRRGQGARGLTEEVQGVFLEEVVFELGESLPIGELGREQGSGG